MSFFFHVSKGWVSTFLIHLLFILSTNLISFLNQLEKRSARILSCFEEFLQTLVRIVRGMDVLADIFVISCSCISHTFITWIILIQLKLLIQRPTRYYFRLKLTKLFKCFPRTRAVIECTELFIQRPNKSSSQLVT